MNKIEFTIKLISPESEELIFETPFSGACLILPIIDGENILFSDPWFYDGLVFWEELEKSSQSTEKYLIFTYISGYADEGGWDYVHVEHTDTTVHWTLYRESERRYIFDKEEYISAIVKLKKTLQNVEDIYILEPQFVIYPE